MPGDGGIPMPARERYYPGTVWTVRDYHEVPEELRGQRVVIFTELMQEDSHMHSSGEMIPGMLYTYVYPDGGSPADTLIRIDDVAWLE